MAVTPNKLFIRVGAGSIGQNLTVADVIAKSKTAGNTTKVFFIADTNQIVVNGVAYGLSTDTKAEIDKIKSILKTYFADGTEDNVKAAIDAVQKALNDYKPVIEAKAFGGVSYVDQKIKFTAVDGSALGEIAASDIVGEHTVASSSYNAETNKLIINFNDGKGGTVPVTIDLGQMLDMNDVMVAEDKKTYFKVEYLEKKLTLTPVVGKLAGEKATAGLADAEEARAYVDAAIAAANGALNDYKKATDARLNVLESDDPTQEGSVAKALADAKVYADDKVADEAKIARAAEAANKKAVEDEAARAKGAETTLTEALATEVTRADTAEKANAASIDAINKALESADTFWDDYKA